MGKWLIAMCEGFSAIVHFGVLLKIAKMHFYQLACSTMAKT
jgi:hypothetical protein